MEILVFILATFIGFILGLLGSGGGILAVPVLVYVQGVGPILATAYSLFVVGTSSFFVCINQIIKKRIEVKLGLLFMLPSMLSLIFTRLYILPSIPKTFFLFNILEIEKGNFIMYIFSLFILITARLMFKNKKQKTVNQNKNNIEWFKVVTIALGEGLISGIVGVGGGFIIVPVLVLLLNINIQRAIATSLFIISIKSIIGFLADVVSINIDWNFLFLFTLFSIVGIWIGKIVRYHIKTNYLKKIFAIFLVILGVYILTKEIIFTYKS